MNRTGKNKYLTGNSFSDKLTTKEPGGRSIAIIIAMVIYSFLLFGKFSNVNGYITVLISSVLYFLTVYLFYGIAVMAYRRKTFLLWGSAVGAVIIGYVFSGLNHVFELLLSWSAILFGGVIAGRMNINNHKQLKAYLYAASVVVIFSMILMFPVWKELATLTAEKSQLMVVEFRENLTLLGYSQEAIADSIALFQKLQTILTRLLPSTMILAFLMQFTLGYLIFLIRLDRFDTVYRRAIPFIYWKMPFAVTPIVIVAISARLLGGEQLKIIADNILAILSVYYFITGLSIVEYYLKKLNISLFMKIVFYVLLFFTQIAGYFVVVLVGFIDSFTDWRKMHTKEIIGME